jgi:rubrerythrin
MDRMERLERIEYEGGEPACWLNLVCEECGKVREDGRCPVCDAGSAEASDDEGTELRQGD